jgi:hypothetical protein
MYIALTYCCKVCITQRKISNYCTGSAWSAAHCVGCAFTVAYLHTFAVVIKVSYQLLPDYALALPWQ